MKIVPGPASEKLGADVASRIGQDVVPVSFRVFPDGESYVRLEGDVHDEDVAVVQTTSPPQDSRLIQLALIADAAKRNGARKIIAVVPYLAYARQDKIFLQGEPLSIETIARMLKTSGVDEIITVNAHKEEILSKLPFPARNISSIPSLAEHFRKTTEGAFAVAPDSGAIHIAEEADRVLRGGHGYLEKHRDRYTGKISIEKKEFSIRGMTAIIFDDIISTGGTIIAAAKILTELRAAAIYAACAHALLIGDAEERIIRAGVREIVGTDTVPGRVSKVTVAPLIAEELLR